MASKLSNSTKYFELTEFTFEDGTTLPVTRVAYLILNPDKTKIAIVHTCFRGRLNTTLTHADGAFKDYKVIVLALFGNGESSSQSNTTNFPKKIEYQDCVNAQYQLLSQKLGIEKVDVMLGFSMGGQITYRWIVSHPKFVKNAVIVCSSAQTSRHNFQFLEGPKAALGNAATPQQGIRAFGKGYSAWLTSAEWFDKELYQELGFETLSAWDEVATGSGYEGWTGEDLLAMLGMWQRGDITKDRGVSRSGLRDTLNAIEARVLLMPCETDQYFRPYVNKREAKDIKDATVEVVPSIWGHIAGGGANAEDVTWMRQKIEAFLRNR
ncbi:alpha/beta-hydrolase [Setomelanomma holmii]|uniref:Alpha/beta-hydrolase n=1 Tax=Setomelanomma holmii TaxID=210430 RepID=A0A9P4LML6_9PLEO|nr:alpha/beta-hydrolase [Setomelanomma holmii]